MNVKQIKNIAVVFVFLGSLLGPSFMLSQTAYALKCADSNQEYHASDNACYTKEITHYGNGSNAQKACEQGGGVYDKNSTTGACARFTRQNAAPVNDNGTKANFTCPANQEYHASDNACYTKEITHYGNGSNAQKACEQGGGVYDKNSTTGACARFTKSTSNPTAQAANANLAYCTKKYVSSGSENLTKERAACEAGQTGKDCNTLSGSEKTACEDGKANPPANGNGGGGAQQGGTGECGGAKTNLISCDGTGITALGNVLKQVLQILTVMIGIIAVGGIAYGAIMYASAQDNSGQTQKAIEVIRNVLIGILLYGFMVVIINWLIPGSVFG